MFKKQKTTESPAKGSSCQMAPAAGERRSRRGGGRQSTAVFWPWLCAASTAQLQVLLWWMWDETGKKVSAGCRSLPYPLFCGLQDIKWRSDRWISDALFSHAYMPTKLALLSPHPVMYGTYIIYISLVSLLPIYNCHGWLGIKKRLPLVFVFELDSELSLFLFLDCVVLEKFTINSTHILLQLLFNSRLPVMFLCMPLDWSIVVRINSTGIISVQVYLPQYQILLSAPHQLHLYHFCAGLSTRSFKHFTSTPVLSFQYRHMYERLPSTWH